jgi:hypothetical protein
MPILEMARRERWDCWEPVRGSIQRSENNEGIQNTEEEGEEDQTED